MGAATNKTTQDDEMTLTDAVVNKRDCDKGWLPPSQCTRRLTCSLPHRSRWSRTTTSDRTKIQGHRSGDTPLTATDKTTGYDKTDPADVGVASRTPNSVLYSHPNHSDKYPGAPSVSDECICWERPVSPLIHFNPKCPRSLQRTYDKQSDSDLDKSGDHFSSPLQEDVNVHTAISNSSSPPLPESNESRLHRPSRKHRKSSPRHSDNRIDTYPQDKVSRSHNGRRGRKTDASRGPDPPKQAKDLLDTLYGRPISRPRGRPEEKSQTSLLIEYFEGSKLAGSSAKPSVRVKVKPLKVTKASTTLQPRTDTGVEQVKDGKDDKDLDADSISSCDSAKFGSSSSDVLRKHRLPQLRMGPELYIALPEPPTAQNASAVSTRERLAALARSELPSEALKNLNPENVERIKKRSEKNARTGGKLNPASTDPRLLAMVEDTIRRMILPEIETMKRERGTRSGPTDTIKSLNQSAVKGQQDDSVNKKQPLTVTSGAGRLPSDQQQPKSVGISDLTTETPRASVRTPEEIMRDRAQRQARRAARRGTNR
jgi:hypothetical protein